MWVKFFGLMDFGTMQMSIGSCGSCSGFAVQVFDPQHQVVCWVLLCPWYLSLRYVVQFGRQHSVVEAVDPHLTRFSFCRKLYVNR